VAVAEAQYEPTKDEELAAHFEQYIFDPLGFVLSCFPWGVEGTHLADAELEDWQRNRLIEIGEKVRANDFNGKDPVEAIRQATASGHGIGKGAFVGMIVHWIMATRPECQGVISANSKPQLKGKTFKELIKWNDMFRETTGCEWFEISLADLWMRHRNYKATWRVDGVAWEERKTEAYQGLHAKHSTAFIILDEASIIPAGVFDVCDGAMKTGEPMFLVFGNPTSNTGYFKKIFKRLRHRWSTLHVDSRTCRITNKKEIQKDIDDHGEDSDYVRIRIRGVFPRSAATQLIPNDVVNAAAYHNDGKSDRLDPLIVGVDVAREGDDESVVAFRRGVDAVTLPWQIHRGLDGNQLGGEVAEFCRQRDLIGDPVDAIFVDYTGVGSSVYDFLSHRGFPVYKVNFGGKPRKERIYLYKGPEMWVGMRDWMEEGGRIPDDPVLHDQLTGRRKEFTPTDRMLLESKKIMKAEGNDSPDRADALALTFASHVAKRKIRDGKFVQRHAQKAKTDYDPLADGEAA
jgi:hypothetical protein